MRWRFLPPRTVAEVLAERGITSPKRRGTEPSQRARALLHGSSDSKNGRERGCGAAGQVRTATDSGIPSSVIRWNVGLGGPAGQEAEPCTNASSRTYRLESHPLRQRKS